MQKRGLYSHIKRNRNHSILLLSLYVAIVLAQGVIAFLVLLIPSYMGPYKSWDKPFISLKEAAKLQFATSNSNRYNIADIIDFVKTHPDISFRVILIILFTLALYTGYSLYHHWQSNQKALGRKLKHSEARPLYNMVENLAIQIGLPMPDIRVVKSKVPNAFAFGLSRRKSSIILTDGLLRILTPQELEAVLAHEMTHIRYGDTQFMTLAQVCFDTGGLTAMLRKYKSPAIAILTLVMMSVVIAFSMLPLFAPDVVFLAILMIILTFLPMPLRSRFASANEFAADAGAIEMTKNPMALVSALRKIEGAERLPVTNAIISAMMIAGPSEGTKATHPPLEERIGAILRHGGVKVGEYMQAAREPRAPVMNAVPSMAFGQRGHAPDAASSFGRRASIDFGGAGASITDEDEKEFRDWLSEQSKDKDFQLFTPENGKYLYFFIILTVMSTIIYGLIF